MNRIWIIVLLALVVAVGCSQESTSKSILASQDAISAGPVDSFGLPLVIEIKAPEVPKAISEPSPPIQEESKNAGGDKR